MKWIGLLGHFCAHTGKIGPGESPEDGEMTLPSRHRIRNSNPGVWGRARHLSITEAPYNTEFYEWMGKKHFCFFQTAETGKRTQTSSSVKGGGANHYPRAPAQNWTEKNRAEQKETERISTELKRTGQNGPVKNKNRK